MLWPLIFATLKKAQKRSNSLHHRGEVVSNFFLGNWWKNHIDTQKHVIYMYIYKLLYYNIHIYSSISCKCRHFGETEAQQPPRL